MLSNYFKIAVRNMRKHRIYSLINILGLATGMACSILILLWLKDELSYDRFNRNADCIYRIAQTEHRDAGDFQTPISYSAMSAILMDEYPGIQNFIRFHRAYDVLVAYGDKCFIEKDFFYADSSVFRVFDFTLVRGDPRTALTEPYSIVVTESVAGKYFGDEDAVGKTLKVDNEKDYLITGVSKDVPHNSHIQFDFLASFTSLNEEYGPLLTSYWAYKCYTYLLIPDPAVADRLNREFSDFLHRHKGEAWKSYHEFYLQPLNRIHLHSNLNYELEPNGDIRYVYIFPLIAIFILLIACINFMNLSTARSTKRTVEVGVRKVLGAFRKNLVGQFLCEAMAFTFIAMLLALLLVTFFLPAFNQISGKSLSVNSIQNTGVSIGLMGILLFVGFVSGSYPAFFLSSFQPVRVIKGQSRAGPSAALFRKILVVIQFSISIVLIVGTLIIRRQLDFIRNERLGFDKENVIVLRVDDEDVKSSYVSLKNALLEFPEILNVAGSSGLPGIISHLSLFRPEGVPEEKSHAIRNICVDHDFIQTLGIGIKEGRDFSKDIFTDAREAFIINEAAAELFGWEAPVNRMLEDLEFKIRGRIIGLTQDFHFQSKHHKIEPLVIQVLPDQKVLHFLSLKVDSHDLKNTLTFIRSTWKGFSPNRPLDFFFLDDYFDKMYRKEDKLNSIFKSFTFLTIFIACLGLFGLAAFTSEQRTKEIGIRKVLGASVSRILFLLSKDFIRLILIANIVSWPVAYYGMHKWLQNFAYRVNIGLWTFILSAGLALAVSLFTISFQAIKAALANPVDSLKYE